MDSAQNRAQSQPETIDLGVFIRVIRERLWFILIVAAVFVAVVLALSLLTTPKYRAGSQLLYKISKLEQALTGSQVFDVRDVNRELQTGAGLVRLKVVAEAVRRELGVPYSDQQILSMVQVRPQSQTNLLVITATSTVAFEAAQIADAFAEQFVDFRRTADRRAVAEASALVEQELQSLPLSERDSGRGLILTDKLKELQILEALQTGGFEIVQRASVPEQPFSPRPVRNSALALLVGLVAGVAAALLLEYLDRRIKDEDTLAEALGIPVLARVPQVGKAKWVKEDKRRSAVPIGFMEADSPTLEAFRTLRSNLQYFQVDKPLRSILITSALPREGKSVTSINLGLSLALSGSRVVLIESDLRRPMLHRYLELSNDMGVSNVLAGTHTFSEAVQLVRVESLAPPHSGAGRPGSRVLQKNMYCVTSGPIPPNPTELIASGKMAVLIESAKEIADYVLVDSPPLLLVADGLSLAGLVDGVIISSHIGHSRVDEAREVRRALERTGARVIGSIASGVSRSKGYYYGYGYGVSDGSEK